MTQRSRAWLRQAERDLSASRHSAAAKDFEWACFAAQQSAENALKALDEKLGGEGRGHSVTKLLRGLADKASIDEELIACGRHLDKLYIPTRYPNGFAEGAPGDFYTEDDSREAIAKAERILEFCRKSLPGPSPDDRHAP